MVFWVFHRVWLRSSSECFLHYEHHAHTDYNTHTVKQTEGDRKSTNCGVSKLVVLSQHGHQIRNPVILLVCCSHDVWMATEIVDQLYPTHSSPHQRWAQPSEKYHPESERRPCCCCWIRRPKAESSECLCVFISECWYLIRLLFSWLAVLSLSLT